MANRKYGREKDEKRSEGGGGISKLGKLSDHVAYRFVQSLAIRSCSSRFWRYCVAILPTKGSAKNFSQLKNFVREQLFRTYRDCSQSIVNILKVKLLKWSKRVTSCLSKYPNK